MEEISNYFHEELNKLLLDIENYNFKLRMIDNEISELNDTEKKIVSHSDNPEYVFQVENMDKKIDEDSLRTIKERKIELESEKENIIKILPNVQEKADKFRRFYNMASYEHNDMIMVNKKLFRKLEFVFTLIDTDTRRAKLELAKVLKEEI